jgi:hypothetical protein
MSDLHHNGRKPGNLRDAEGLVEGRAGQGNPIGPYMLSCEPLSSQVKGLETSLMQIIGSESPACLLVNT